MKREARILGEGKYLRLYDDDGWEYVERVHSNGVVVILAVTPDDRLLLVEQYRPAVRASVLALPAGLVGDEPQFAGEDFEVAAARELEEETGWRAGRLELINITQTSSGMTSERRHLFRARDLEPVGPGGGDDSEDITVHAVPVSEVRAWLEAVAESGRKIESNLYAGLYWLNPS
ncbi:MAG: NUDIX hydrolase [Planctomycetota bacterium]